MDFAEAFLEDGGGGGALLAELGVAVDDREEVVEIVGDAAGEGAEALHLVRLAELVLELLALGDVFPETEEIGDLAGGAAEARGLDGFPHGGAVAALGGEFAAPLAAGAECLPEFTVGLVGGMTVAEDLGGVVEIVFEGAAAHLGELGVHVLGLAFDVGDDDGNRGLLDGAGEAVKLLFGEALAGHIAADRPDADEFAGGVAERRFFPGEPAHALGGEPALFGAGARGGEAREERGDVVGIENTRDGRADELGGGAAKFAREGEIGGEDDAGAVAGVGAIGAVDPGAEVVGAGRRGRFEVGFAQGGRHRLREYRSGGRELERRVKSS